MSNEQLIRPESEPVKVTLEIDQQFIERLNDLLRAGLSLDVHPYHVSEDYALGYKLLVNVVSNLRDAGVL